MAPADQGYDAAIPTTEGLFIKYVLDSGVVLRFLDEGRALPTRHQLLAPTLIRSQVLDSLYQLVHRGEVSEVVGRKQLAQFAGSREIPGIADIS